jgi:plastocyanin
MHRLRLVLTVSALGALIGLAGCSSSSPSYGTTATTVAKAPGSSAGVTSPAGDAVSIENFSFSPTPLTVKVGATNTVANNDQTDHTFSDSHGTFDTGHITPGSSKLVTITKAGTYTYHCQIHPSMTGVIQAS